jgi:hypothetical protein
VESWESAATPGLAVLENPGARIASLETALPGIPRLAPRITKTWSEPPVSSPGRGLALSTSMLTAPSDVPLAPGISCTCDIGAFSASGTGYSNASVYQGVVADRDELEGTMSTSPTLTANGVAGDKCGDVTERAAG